MDPLAAEYTSSMLDDISIFYPTIRINMAHAIMLAERGIIPKKDAAALLRALIELNNTDISKFDFKPELEDIHIVIEEFVAKATSVKIGGRLHTAKSRNDQVSAAIRIALRISLLDVGMLLLRLIDTMMTLAEKNVETVMPGYTHLQVAEPTTFAHYMLAYCSAFLRDVERIEQAYNSANSCPMGACALSGTSFQIDRARVAGLLGFDRIEYNTMDAVGSRDFILQSMSAFAILMVNLSRLAEEISIWTSTEFDMIEIPDEFVSTSSIMPQKRNPVVAEISRAKTSCVIGNLVGAMTMLKALPQAYNLDFQELSPLLWSSVDEAKSSLEVMGRMLGKLKPKKEIMRKRAEHGFSMATELADTLVRKTGLAFREAHSVVGRMIVNALERGKSAEELSLEDLLLASKEVLGKKVELKPEDLKASLDVENCVFLRSVPGGPAPKSVRKHIKLSKQISRRHSKLLRSWKRALTMSEKNLLKCAGVMSR